MSSKLDESDFVDRDLEATKEAGAPSHGVDDSTATAPPSREELTSRVNETQQKLAELKRIQEEVEREIPRQYVGAAATRRASGAPGGEGQELMVQNNEMF